MKKKEKIQISTTTEELNKLLTPMIAAINHFLEEAGIESAKKKETKKVPKDISRMAIILQELKTLLEEGNFEAVKKSEELTEFAEDDTNGREVEKIREKIANYEFDEAARLTELLLKVLK